MYSKTNSEFRIIFDFKSLKSTPPHILLKMMLKMNLIKNGKGIEEFTDEKLNPTRNGFVEFASKQLNTNTITKIKEKEEQKKLQMISTLNETGDSIYPPSEHVWNNYNENEQQIRFEDWNEENE